MTKRNANILDSAAEKLQIFSGHGSQTAMELAVLLMTTGRPSCGESFVASNTTAICFYFLLLQILTLDLEGVEMLFGGWTGLGLEDISAIELFLGLAGTRSLH